MKAVHSNRCSVSRRAFLGTAATAGTGILMPASAFARTHDGDRDDHEQEGVRPNPIPGGVAPLAPFGIFIHHKPPTPGLPLASINEPSQITDFSGFVGVTRIRGGGMGTNTLTGAKTPLAFQADMGFNQGQFIGTDGKRHYGTFGFVWLDLYTGPVGSAALATQIHDYNPHIESNGLFWTVPVASDAVEVDFDDARATLRVKGLNVFDDHDLGNSLTSGLGLPAEHGFPFIAPVFPRHALVSFEVEWTGLLAATDIDNVAQGFKGSFLQTGATIKWSARQDGFHFESEAPNPARNLFAVIGHEKNGIFAR